MAISDIVRYVAETAADTVRPMVQETIRDTVRRTVLLVIALILLAGVFVFAEIAFYLWLRTQTAPYYAAAIVAGVTLFLALIVLAFALAGGGRSKSVPTAARRASAVEPEPDPESATLRAEAEASARFRVNGDQWTNLAADAEALGRMVGKEAKGYPLVIGAFVVGLLLARARDD